MLKQTIESIIEAEKKADKIVNDALSDAKTMSENAAVEAEKIKNDTVKKVKAERQKVIETANKGAEENYNNIISLGKKEAEKILSKTKTDKVIDLIKIKVLNRYGKH